MMRLQAMGLNTIQTYVPWNWHEIEEGVFDFSGPRNISQFFSTAQSLGMNVLLRAGPYICGEHVRYHHSYIYCRIPCITMLW
jgi:beta-galactosidase GanA